MKGYRLVGGWGTWGGRGAGEEFGKMDSLGGGRLRQESEMVVFMVIITTVPFLSLPHFTNEKPRHTEVHSVTCPRSFGH